MLTKNIIKLSYQLLEKFGNYNTYQTWQVWKSLGNIRIGNCRDRNSKPLDHVWKRTEIVYRADVSSNNVMIKCHDQN